MQTVEIGQQELLPKETSTARLRSCLAAMCEAYPIADSGGISDKAPGWCFQQLVSKQDACAGCWAAALRKTNVTGNPTAVIGL